MKFKNKRYITKGVNERVPLLTQLFMWHCIDTLDVPKDYLQVFKCSGYDGKRKIIHIQESLNIPGSICLIRMLLFLWAKFLRLMKVIQQCYLRKNIEI